MKLEEIFESGEFLLSRNKELDHLDTEYILKRLRDEDGQKIYEILPYLRVVETVPDGLLEPIIREAIEYKDISLPKRWMNTINRLFTPEKVQDELLQIISSNESLRVKCRAVGILYCVDIPGYEEKIDERGEIQLKCRDKYIWNGKRYERTCRDCDIETIKKRRREFSQKRLKILVNEFVSNKNLVYRYYIGTYLSFNIDDYPEEIIEKTKEVIKIISGEEFPSGINQVEQLRDAIQFSPELENLLYQELNWQRR